MVKEKKGKKTSTGPKLQKATTQSLEERLLSKSDNWYYEKITAEEKKAVYDYTIHNYTKDEKQAQEIADLESALAKYELDEDIVTYRGVSSTEFVNAMLDGSGKTDFKSTSINKAQAEKFAVNQGGWVIEYHIKKGKHGAYLDSVPMHKEKEYLINKGQNFKVIERKDKTLIVEIG